MTKSARPLAAVALAAVALAAVLPAALPSPAVADVPQPRYAPVNWQLDFDWRKPRRIEVGGTAYWYMVYTVTNNTDAERLFLPSMELVTRNGQILQANANVPMRVYEEIEGRVRGLPLEPPQQVEASRLLIGQDRAKSSVAIWAEPVREMGQFEVYVGGLSGEIERLKNASGEDLTDADGNPILVRKTKQLQFKVRGDDVANAPDEVQTQGEEWIMR